MYLYIIGTCINCSYVMNRLNKINKGIKFKTFLYLIFSPFTDIPTCAAYNNNNITLLGEFMQKKNK